LDIGKQSARTCEAVGSAMPKIFCVNWFRKNTAGKFVWPGYGDNMRVLKWILQRVEGVAQGTEHFLGTSPRYADLDWVNLAFKKEDFHSAMAIDKAAWHEELNLHRVFFTQLAYHLPEELVATHTVLTQRLAS